MGFLDELKKLTRPYDDEDDFIEKDVITPQEERGTRAAARAAFRFGGFCRFFRACAPGSVGGTPARQ